MFSQLAEAIIKGLASRFVYWSCASRNKPKINGFEKDQKHGGRRLSRHSVWFAFLLHNFLCRVWNMQHIAAYSWRIRTAEAMESSIVLMQTQGKSRNLFIRIVLNCNSEFKVLTDRNKFKTKWNVITVLLLLRVTLFIQDVWSSTMIYKALLNRSTSD